ncbi:hypothetical protein [Psychroserpens sp. S379A]|uniref:hypothetical protein n=1 Tax=Psychroserpens sp. S379A TaxID=3415137 RepID=UPI003C79DB1F
MKETTNKYLIAALLLGLAFHGSSIFFTLETTYDALIHLFFAEHYASSWFEPWSFKWYTGFTVMSYPPLVHQSIALLSLVGGLKFGLFTVALIAIVLFITGVYRFSLLISGNRNVAGYAAILCVFSSSFVETLHIFGQLPSIVGISVLMHALPEIYLWLRTGKLWYLCTSLSLVAVTVTSHHVTPIFGMVFFIFPLIGMAIMDHAKAATNSYKAITFKLFFASFLNLFKRIVVFGVLALIIIITCILPYWINSKNNPITQVPIPHGSRDSFIDVTSSGLVFFLVPWGILLFILPYIFYRYYSKRYLFFGLSISALSILGTGGTTVIPKMVLGETAFNILTLDRFTLWASIMSLPIFGEFVYRFVEKDIKLKIQTSFGAIYHRLLGGFLAALFVFMAIFTISLGYFRPSQPDQIKMLPIVNFLNQDDHDKWRFLTLGFGDQMAWLSAQTNAMSVDGNYHSARRLPELTTRPIERLENSKFKGVAGIGSLQQFLTTPEKYNLKYIFSNDKFYDPILYFCGWQRLRQLENGIMVWERLNVPPIPSILPKNNVDTWQKVLWGTIPILTLLIAFILNIQMILVHALKTKKQSQKVFLNYKSEYSKISGKLINFNQLWGVTLVIIISVSIYNLYLKKLSQSQPEDVVLAYYDALDFKKFETAFELINPKTKLTLEDYMLQVSVTDGLLSSYAKLDAISTQILKQSTEETTIEVKTKWITPLEKIHKKELKSLSKVNGHWYLNPEDINNDLPPDQLYTQNTTRFFNQGRRRITTEQTYHEDILKQPVLEVLHAKLVKHKNQYAIIGEVQNIDNVPADVVLKGTLYNDDNKELATYNAKYHMKHKLMPKEVTAFRINFEGIAWTKIQDSIPKSFNPDEFTPIELNEQPTKFNLQAAGNVSGSGLYKNVSISQLQLHATGLSGELFNSGTEEVTIPQLLFSYYDENKSLVWVDHLFLKEGIRQQRKQNFDYILLKSNTVEVINDDLANVFVNGLPNDAISNKIIPKRKENHSTSELQVLSNSEFSYIKIESNAYIGNPN